MSYLPEKTIRYKTYVKTALVEALQPVFTNHVDSKLQNTKVTIDLPKERQSFPAVVIRFYEKEIYNAGIGHEEHIGDNRVQRVTLLNAGGGTFTLSLKNEDTAPIAFDASSSDVENALIDLSTLTSDSVSVEGNDGGPYVVTFTENVDPLVIDGTKLIGINVKTIVKPVNVYKFKHSLYNADIEFMIYALSSLDRDLIADTIVQTLRFGDLSTYTNNFFNRIYPSNFDAVPDSIGHFININTDRIQGTGEAETEVPWGAEDDLIYNLSYRVAIFGEFYSLPPETPYEYISKVWLYPYIDGVDPVPNIGQ